MIFQVEGVHVVRDGRYRPATRAELDKQARQLGLAGCSRMTKHELARAVARARSRPAALGAAARGCREQLAGVAAWTVAVPVAALGRLRWIDRFALPLATVVLAAGVGASMPILITAGTPDGVVAPKVTPVPAVQGSPDLGRPVETSQKPVRPTGDRVTPSSTRNVILAVAPGGGSSAGAGRTAAPAASSEGGTPEPSGSQPPQAASGGAEQDTEEPTPEPTEPAPTEPAPTPPVDEAPEEETPEEKATVCHNAGSKNAKTIEVGADAAAEHLAHGDTLGACP